MTTLEMCDAIDRIDSKLDMMLGIFANASVIDFNLISDGLYFTVNDIQHELANIRDGMRDVTSTTTTTRAPESDSEGVS